MSEETKKPEELTSGSEPTAANESAKPVDPDRAARDAARAERAAARAAAKAAAEAAGAAGGDSAKAVDPDRAARDAARAERAAARAAAKAAEAGGEGDAPKEPSPNQPKLDRLVAIIHEHIGEGVVTESYINERDRHLPCIVVDKSRWREVAELLRDHAELKLTYLRNVTGVDYETHMEVDYFLINLQDKQDYCVKVRTDRDQPEMPSAAPVWEAADWDEREIYDLLGITFTGHPNLKRIMLPDDWVGHPLRKDYEPVDPEV